MPPKKSSSAKPNPFLRFFLAPGARSAWKEASGAALTRAHRLSHDSNRALAAWYECVYELHRLAFSAKTTGPALELGSGGSDFKKTMPALITSDVLPVEGVDKVIDAQSMALDDGSVGNITMINVLHHIPKPLRFFAEADRVLKPGGRLVMTEPYVSWLSFPIYRIFHHEPVVMDAPGLELATGGDALLDANQAIPTLLLERHLNEIYGQAPNLRLVSMRRHSALSYFLTGGVNYRSPMPLWAWRAVAKLDDWTCWLAGRYCAAFMTAVFEKRDHKEAK